MKSIVEKINEGFYDNISDYPGKGLTYFIYSYCEDDNNTPYRLNLRIAKSKDYKVFTKYEYKLPDKSIIDKLNKSTSDFMFKFDDDFNNFYISVKSNKNLKYKNFKEELRKQLNTLGFSDETQKIAFYVFKDKYIV